MSTIHRLGDTYAEAAPANELVGADDVFANAERALADAHTLAEVVDVRDGASAIQAWMALQKRGLAMQNRAAEIKLRAERKAGGMLAEVPRNERARTDLSATHDGVQTYQATIEDAGIPQETARRWQRVAEVPEERFEEYLTTGTEEELTTAGLLRKAHVSHNSGENQWYTPPKYAAAARRVMGGIDLDPASSSAANAAVGATTYFTEEQDGLAQQWRGNVWLNPPYSHPLIEEFSAKLSEEYEFGFVQQACVLTNNSTETKWFQALFSVASAICLPKGRVRFWSPEKESATPLQGQAVLYLGDRVEQFCEVFSEFGSVALAVTAVAPVQTVMGMVAISTRQELHEGGARW